MDTLLYLTCLTVPYTRYTEQHVRRRLLAWQSRREFDFNNIFNKFHRTLSALAISYAFLQKFKNKLSDISTHWNKIIVIKSDRSWFNKHPKQDHNFN